MKNDLNTIYRASGSSTQMQQIKIDGTAYEDVNIIIRNGTFDYRTRVLSKMSVRKAARRYTSPEYDVS